MNTMYAYDEDVDARVLDLEDEVERLRAQNAALQAQVTAGHKRSDTIRYLEEQNDMLQEALILAERNARPEGTAFTADIPWDDIVAEYRHLSRVNRGPVPDDLRMVLADVEDDVREAMLEAAKPLITRAVRRVVRRRRSR